MLELIYLLDNHIVLGMLLLVPRFPLTRKKSKTEEGQDYDEQVPQLEKPSC